jgi:hypothetical protein
MRSFIRVTMLLVLSAPVVHAATHRAALDCPRAPWFAEGDQTDCRFGTISPAGDVNGDGFPDVVIGSYNHSDGETHEGRIFVYYGRPGGLAPAWDWSFESNQANAQMGDKLSGAGDVNGDGYGDLVVGAVGYDSTFTDEGRAYLFLGGPAGLAASPAWSTLGGQPGGAYGSCVRGAGDVNGDGYDDVIVGAWLYDTTLLDAGKAFLYLGGPNGLSVTPAWSAGGEAVGAVFGYFVNAAGDLNGDGYGDIVVGSRRYSGGGITREGKVYVYYGSPSGPSTLADWTLTGGIRAGEFGAAVGGAGDVNGDGYDDLLVGAFRQSVPDSAEGRAYVFLGGPGGLSSTPAWVAEGGQKNAEFGYHLGAGDLNHDGYSDIVVSAVTQTVDGLPDAGRVYAYEGGPLGLSTTPAWVFDGDQAGQRLGDAVTVLGDVDRDGYDDIGVGALYRDNAFVDAGRAYVFYSCADSLTPAAVGAAPPAALRLALAGANPFASSTDFTWTLERPSALTIRVFDAAGRGVRTLARGVRPAGLQRLRWDGRDDSGRPVPRGTYFVDLRAPGTRATLRLIRI